MLFKLFRKIFCIEENNEVNKYEMRISPGKYKRRVFNPYNIVEINNGFEDEFKSRDFIGDPEFCYLSCNVFYSDDSDRSDGE